MDQILSFFMRQGMAVHIIDFNQNIANLQASLFRHWVNGNLFIKFQGLLLILLLLLMYLIKTITTGKFMWKCIPIIKTFVMGPQNLWL